MISSNILWIDLETTGSNEEWDDVIEIGAAITDERLGIISQYTQVYQISPNRVDQMDAQVLQMHTSSGLLALARAGSFFAPNDEALRAWLGGHLRRGDVIPLGGSGVAHFDLRFIKRVWPDIARRLTFWSYDVGSVRRFARLAGVQSPITDAQKPHRAMDDILLHIEEARWYIEFMKGAKP